MKGNHSRVVFLDTPLHVDAVTDSSKLPWHKYLKRQYSKNNHPYNSHTSLFPALDNVKVVTTYGRTMYLHWIYGIILLSAFFNWIGNYTCIVECDNFYQQSCSFTTCNFPTASHLMPRNFRHWYSTDINPEVCRSETGPSHSSVDEDAHLLGCYTVLTDKWLPTVDEGFAIPRNISHYLDEGSALPRNISRHLDERFALPRNISHYLPNHHGITSQKTHTFKSTETYTMLVLSCWPVIIVIYCSSFITT